MNSAKFHHAEFHHARILEIVFVEDVRAGDWLEGAFAGSVGVGKAHASCDRWVVHAIVRYGNVVTIRAEMFSFEFEAGDMVGVYRERRV